MEYSQYLGVHTRTPTTSLSACIHACSRDRWPHNCCGKPRHHQCAAAATAAAAAAVSLLDEIFCEVYAWREKTKSSLGGSFCAAGVGRVGVFDVRDALLWVQTDMSSATTLTTAREKQTPKPHLGLKPSNVVEAQVSDLGSRVKREASHDCPVGGVGMGSALLIGGTESRGLPKDFKMKD